MGAIADFLARDHDRLDALFSRADEDGRSYEAFRRGLLKHVGMEEVILVPAARRLSGKAPSLAAKIRLDHAALTGLLIPAPTRKLLGAIRTILQPHNVLEEEHGGLYEQCERAVGLAADDVYRALLKAPEIPPAAHVDSPQVFGSIEKAVAAAGFPGLPIR